MARLADRHPGLDIQLVAISGVLSLSKREADIAVTLSAPREGRLISRKLTDYGLSLYAAPAYLDTRPPIRTRADMAGQRFIGYIGDLLYAPELDYMQVAALSIEVRQKLSKHRPETLGLASRISGVTPAAISLLLVHLKKNRFRGFAETGGSSRQAAA